MFHGSAFYLQQQVVTKGKGIIQRARGRPLLFYAVDGLSNEFHDGRFKSPVITLEVLLNNGADPMETFNGRTAWSHLVDHISKSDGVKRPQSELLKIYGLILEHGADPTNRLKPLAYYTHECQQHWSVLLKNKDYSTTFHHVLGYSGTSEAIVKLLVDHRNDLEVTDSDGIGIQEWADYLNPDMGALVRQEIAAKQRRKRRRED